VQLDSELLRTFLAVSETRSFTLAGGKVRRSQGAVSQQVKKLEDMLGSPLFIRSMRGIELTPSGTELLTNARRIVSLLDETAGSFNSAPLRGPVRIGLPDEYGQTILARALHAFASVHQYVEVTARYGRSAENLERVRSGELDLGVCFNPEDDPRGELLTIDPTVWVTSTIHLNHERTPVPVALYTNSGWCTEFAVRGLEDSGVEYRTVFTSETNGGLMLAVSSGLAIAPLSRSSIPAGCRELTADEGFACIDESRVILHRSPKSTSPAVVSMADAIKAAFLS
jgi:DNA-binding transcriptional LysR family regulator